MKRRRQSSVVTQSTQAQLPEIIRASVNEGSKLLDDSIANILRLMREELVMDIVFVSRYAGDQVTVEHASQEHGQASIQGLTHARGESFCQRVLDGRLPAVIPDVAALAQTHELPRTPVVPSAFMAAPVLLHSGELYGTLCCWSLAALPELGERHRLRLQMSARQIARLVDEAGGQ